MIEPAALLRVLALQDYNTRVVVAAAALLGLAAGLVGSLMLLRKRALLGDAISHATLPGIALAFIVMGAAGGTGKWLPGLLLGGALSGLLGMGFVLLVRAQTRLKEDAALGLVLSVFFGGGVALLGVIQKMEQGHAAGLESFIYGKTASMLGADAWLMAGVALLASALCGLLFKEFALLCFDTAFARSLGWRTAWLDALLMGLVVVVTVAGLQAVGLILVLALLVIPPAAARFWTQRMGPLPVIAGVLGAVSGYVGASLSALLPRWPAGAVIVLVAFLFFLVSLMFGRERGLWRTLRERQSLTRRVARQHLLRALFELQEGARPDGPPPAATWTALLARRSWTPRALRRAVSRAVREQEVYVDAQGGLCLTPEGWAEARRLVRNHRLWELYLITHADIAPSHVDRDADQIEHVLGRGLVAQLEQLLERAPVPGLPPSPHPLP